MKSTKILFATVIACTCMIPASADEIGGGKEGYYPLQPSEESCEGLIDCTIESMSEWFEPESSETSE